jgi:hypothetical protein
MGEYPKVEALLRDIAKRPNDRWMATDGPIAASDIATELRALLAARDAWVTERAVLRQECEDRAECEQSLTRWNDELAADRDAWKAKAEDAERRLDHEKALRFEAQRPAARRLRVVQFDGYDDWYRWNDGTLEALVGNPPRWKVQKHIRTEWIYAVAALRDDPFEPVETLEDVVRTALFDTASQGYSIEERGSYVANALRTWLAQQPTPPQDAATTRGEG